MDNGTLAQTQNVRDPRWPHGAKTWRKLMTRLVDDGQVPPNRQ
jgi:hypothetical protein